MRLRQGDTKAGVAAYERAVAETRTESAALLSGLARALISDGRASVSFQSPLSRHRSTGAHTKPSVAVYEHAVAETRTESEALLSGLSGLARAYKSVGSRLSD